MNAKDFIDNYENYYKDIEEIDEPSAPLPDDLDLPIIFADETEIFSIFFPEEMPRNSRLNLLKEILIISDGLKMKKLTNKISSIIAYYLRHLNK